MLINGRCGNIYVYFSNTITSNSTTHNMHTKLALMPDTFAVIVLLNMVYSLSKSGVSTTHICILNRLVADPRTP